MWNIFEDEGRIAGGFLSSPNGVWSKSALTASHSLESAPHFQRSRSLGQRILSQIVIHTRSVHAA